MNTKYVIVVVAMAALMIDSSVPAPSACSALAKYKRHNSHATSLAESCENGKFTFNTLCQGVGGNLNVDGGSLAIPAVQIAGDAVFDNATRGPSGPPGSPGQPDPRGLRDHQDKMQPAVLLKVHYMKFLQTVVNEVAILHSVWKVSLTL